MPRTTTSGHLPWDARATAVEPTSSPVTLPSPGEPTTISRALRDSSISRLVPHRQTLSVVTSTSGAAARGRSGPGQPPVGLVLDRLSDLVARQHHLEVSAGRYRVAVHQPQRSVVTSTVVGGPLHRSQSRGRAVDTDQDRAAGPFIVLLRSARAHRALRVRSEPAWQERVWSSPRCHRY